MGMGLGMGIGDGGLGMGIGGWEWGNEMERKESGCNCLKCLRQPQIITIQ